ncbi:PREDICTED: uncharacterized protein LOC107340792 [Acropora digitifera]|uniref:uncharacterized protein LOC107340792 n=1 Tax=Acropora digitifera TaxID=70779 RepID=UPI00077ADFC8|nr:PREDICTED: uncharacterized protein LOC107340792 [Acropora digitifera]
MNIRNKIVDITHWITSNKFFLKACKFTSYYWTSFGTILINWTWQDTFDVMIAFWITDYCFMALYVTTAFVEEIMRRRRDALQLERELEEAKKEEEELQRKLEEEERAQQVVGILVGLISADYFATSIFHYSFNYNSPPNPPSSKFPYDPNCGKCMYY